MSFELLVESRHELCLAIANDDISIQHLLELNRSEVEHPDLRPHFSQIILPRSFQLRIRFTTQEMNEYARLPRCYGKDAKRAIVVADELGLGYARMFELIKFDIAGDIEVCETLAQACEHVGIGEQTVIDLISARLPGMTAVA